MKSTGYFRHTSGLRHEMGEGHPECPERLTAIDIALRASSVWPCLREVVVPYLDENGQDLTHRPMPHSFMVALQRAHSAAYLAQLQHFSATLQQPDSDDASRLSEPAYIQIDPDTRINRHSWHVAQHATMTVLAAVDAVLGRKLQNAFCAVRPPGHHACRSRAMGFCLINHVAVAALHALVHHGLSRVAIVDFDVHHGNGTEDILAGDDRVLMVGLYQQHLYPYRDATPAAPNMCSHPLPAGSDGEVLRSIVCSDWLPRLQAFAPDLILMSAGFDAHRLDPLAHMALVEEDYAWMTCQLQKVAVQHAQGRMVSCLEGGYHLPALASSVLAHVQALSSKE